MDQDGYDQRAADPQVNASSDAARQSRQISADQKRLNEHDAEADDPANPAAM